MGFPKAYGSQNSAQKAMKTRALGKVTLGVRESKYLSVAAASTVVTIFHEIPAEGLKGKQGIATDLTSSKTGLRTGKDLVPQSTAQARKMACTMTKGAPLATRPLCFGQWTERPGAANECDCSVQASLRASKGRVRCRARTGQLAGCIKPHRPDWAAVRLCEGG